MTSPSESRAVHVFLFSALLAGCFVLWLAFVGSLRRNELIVGALSVVLATAFLVFVERCEELKLELNAGDAMQGLWIPWYIVIGVIEILVILAKGVARIETPKSLFLVAGFRALTGPPGNGRRVLAVLYTTVTPNFIVISIDPDRQEMLYHQLEKSGLPGMTSNLGAFE